MTTEASRNHAIIIRTCPRTSSPTPPRRVVRRVVSKSSLESSLKNIFKKVSKNRIANTVTVTEKFPKLWRKSSEQGNIVTTFKENVPKSARSTFRILFKQKQQEVPSRAKTGERYGGTTMQAPEKKFQAGAVSAAVWKNNTKDGKKEFRTVSFERSYKDPEGDWKTSSSLGIADIPKAIVVLTKVYEYLTLKGSEEELVV